MSLSAPEDPHFPLSRNHVVDFAGIFSQARTIQRYLAGLRFASRLLGLSDLADDPVLRAIVRGAIAPLRARPEMPRLRKDHVLDLVRHAVDAGNIELARVVSIARLFLLRVRSELEPLRVGPLPPGSHTHSRGHTRTCCAHVT